MSSITLGNDLGELTRLESFITGYCEERGLSSMELNLVAEEYFVNAVRHGFAQQIELAIDLRDNLVTMTFQDDGSAFDPLSAPEFDPETPMEQRRAGGLGIHLVRRLMDELHYQRVNGRNRLTMQKRLARH